mmetsp:Transcript_36753/g.118184  ORF Transcript_36753/g.118184 Transcript_36753/m.118184 type:complete len:274 (+) Transcript_36753:800-1621(+)
MQAPGALRCGDGSHAGAAVLVRFCAGRLPPAAVGPAGRPRATRRQQPPRPLPNVEHHVELLPQLHPDLVGQLILTVPLRPPARRQLPLQELVLLRSQIRPGLVIRIAPKGGRPGRAGGAHRVHSRLVVHVAPGRLQPRPDIVGQIEISGALSDDALEQQPVDVLLLALTELAPGVVVSPPRVAVLRRQRPARPRCRLGWQLPHLSRGGHRHGREPERLRLVVHKQQAAARTGHRPEFVSDGVGRRELARALGGTPVPQPRHQHRLVSRGQHDT